MIRNRSCTGKADLIAALTGIIAEEQTNAGRLLITIAERSCGTVEERTIRKIQKIRLQSGLPV